ncbi:MAG: Fic family protein [Bradymonadaceae bacterium]
MDRGKTGVAREVDTDVGEAVEAFVPDPLPPSPPLDFSNQLDRHFEAANQSLGRLDGMTKLLPDTSLFIYFYIRKEAVLSSRIEGTQSSLSDLLLYENEQEPRVPMNDVEEVSNYVAALEHGLDRIRNDDFPISVRLFREIHRILLSSGRVSDKQPGELRRSQNWIGGSRPGTAEFVPPPPDKVRDCLGELEQFLHGRRGKFRTTLKAALAHAQFETIHPFLDGNGRLGRLLVTLLFCAEGVLREPTLYLSLYFKRHREEYYERLQRIRTDGEWEEWIAFFLNGVEDVASQSVDTAQRILQMFDRDRRTIERELGQAARTTLQVHEYLKANPVTTIQDIADETSPSEPTVGKAVQRLEGLDILEEVTGKKRNRVWIYREYVDILDEGTETN